jgi:hypothetical protein
VEFLLDNLRGVGCSRSGREGGKRRDRSHGSGIGVLSPVVMHLHNATLSVAQIFSVRLNSRLRSGCSSVPVCRGLLEGSL